MLQRPDAPPGAVKQTPAELDDAVGADQRRHHWTGLAGAGGIGRVVGDAEAAKPAARRDALDLDPAAVRQRQCPAPAEPPAPIDERLFLDLDHRRQGLGDPVDVGHRIAAGGGSGGLDPGGGIVLGGNGRRREGNDEEGEGSAHRPNAKGP